MPPRRPTRCALVTGATRGIGYGAAKLLIQRNPLMEAFLTTKTDVRGRKPLLRLEIGPDERRATFVQMDVTNQDSIFKTRDLILKKYKGLDILINNAAVYHAPDPSPAAFPKQVESTLAVNYWGLKSVVKTFIPHLNPHARMINMTSNLGEVKNIGGDFPGAKDLRKRFSSYLDEDDLDALMFKFEEDVKKGIWREEGWPACAYTISKIAINAYTRILQQQLDSEDVNKSPDLVVNAVYAGTHHSKINQTNVDLVNTEEGARTVVYMAHIARNSYGMFPRGAVVWNNLQVKEDMDDFPVHKPQYRDL